MQKVIFIFFLVIFTNSCSSTKESTSIDEPKNFRYFNENNIEISEVEFDKIRSTRKFLSIVGDSVNHKRLLIRENRGELNNIEAFRELLVKGIEKELDSTKPIVIIYHPGKDSCNSTGSSKKLRIRNWYKKLEEGLNNIAQVKPIYIFKDNAGLKKYKGIIEWKKDPEGMIEKLFFKKHYPCSSFVVISSKGEFVSYFGEFPKEFVWKATQLITD